MTAPAILLVVAKSPVPGQVKTRLTPALTSDEAAAVAAAALLDTLDLVRLVAAETGSRIVLALAGDLLDAPAGAAVGRAIGDLVVVAQRGDGLAARLAHAHLAAAGDFGPCVQLGMDSPHAPVSAVVEACHLVTATEGPDVVLGPASDGGWWCLGLRRAGDARHLVEVAMSTSHTGAATEQAFRAAGRTVVRTATVNDLDTVSDLAEVATAAPGSRVAALAAVLLPAATDLEAVAPR